MDLVPNNAVTAEIFDALCTKGTYTYPGRLIVIPTLGSEYPFLKHIRKTGLFDNADIIDTYLLVKPYKNHAWLEGKSKRKYRTYEKFAKLIIDRDLHKCIGDPILYEKDYCRMDCKCKRHDTVCRDESLDDKAFDVISQYDILPRGNKWQNKTIRLDTSKVFDIIEDYVKTTIERAKLFDEITENKLAAYKKSLDSFIDMRRVYNAKHHI
jgi:hypothetical protein